MAQFETHRNAFSKARLTRKENGVLEVALHSNGGKLVFNGHTHEQPVDLFHAIGEDRDNSVVILVGTGDAFMDLMKLLDIEVPATTALNGPVLLHCDYALLTARFRDPGSKRLVGRVRHDAAERDRPWSDSSFYQGRTLAPDP